MLKHKYKNETSMLRSVNMMSHTKKNYYFSKKKLMHVICL